jgi:hypothetical protein
MSDIKWDETQASPATEEALRYGRRLSDKILIAFHHACDKQDVETAEDLLATLSRIIARPAPSEMYNRRKIAETQADANYRLWDLRRQEMPGTRMSGALAHMPPLADPT